MTVAIGSQFLALGMVKTTTVEFGLFCIASNERV